MSNKNILVWGYSVSESFESVIGKNIEKISPKRRHGWCPTEIGWIIKGT